VGAEEDPSGFWDGFSDEEEEKAATGAEQAAAPLFSPRVEDGDDYWSSYARVDDAIMPSNPSSPIPTKRAEAWGTGGETPVGWTPDTRTPAAGIGKLFCAPLIDLVLVLIYLCSLSTRVRIRILWRHRRLHAELPSSPLQRRNSSHIPSSDSLQPPLSTKCRPIAPHSSPYTLFGFLLPSSSRSARPAPDARQVVIGLARSLDRRVPRGGKIGRCRVPSERGSRSCREGVRLERCGGMGGELVFPFSHIDCISTIL
jgi:hypothetical protein